MERDKFYEARMQAMIYCCNLVEEHGVDRAELMAKTNVNGSAIALGHPVGISGNRIMVSMNLDS